MPTATSYDDCIVLIPARLAATRLPNKPLLKIAGREMVLHCYDRARAAAIGRVMVCAGDQEIVDTVKAAGGEAMLSPADLPSGTDRISYVLEKLADGDRYQRIINLQADLPNINPTTLKKIADSLMHKQHEMVTAVFEEKNEKNKNNPNMVKAICHLDAKKKIGRVLYFTRAPAPYGNHSFFHHIGIYGYQRKVLELFVGLKPSPLEKIEKLEQLRALENGINIFALAIDDRPQSVDTAEDLAKAQKIMA
ncbi:MAG: 3-deoxy-manno-octulosonate cytidylyltransferase [Alphaproteobacteria bacterium]|nr:3-deoxy-manno-octulosonate cytidylyltransferase [Alphaproteobacteria bacterium]